MPDAAPVVAVYSAVLVLEIERSDFAVIDAALAGIAPGTFDDTPGFSDDPAPAPSAPLAEKLLRRLLSVFGFGAPCRATTLPGRRSSIGTCRTRCGWTC
jgi:hypothetical protein